MSKELRKQIISVLRKFSMDPHNSPLKKQKDRDLVGRFIDRVHSTEFDAGSLPYWSRDGLAKHHNKSECVFALVCDVVETYWTVACEVDAEFLAIFKEDLEGKLKRLETVYNNYDQLKVLGDAKGYCLFASQLPKPKEEAKDGGEEVKSESASEETSQEETTEGTKSTADSEETQIIKPEDVGSMEDLGII